MKSIKTLIATLLWLDVLNLFALPSFIKIGESIKKPSFRRRRAQVTFSACLPFLRFHSGAIFREDQRDSHQDLAFKFAVHKINKDQHILPRTTLIYDIQYVKADDSFHANKQGDLSPFSFLFYPSATM